MQSHDVGFLQQRLLVNKSNSCHLLRSAVPCYHFASESLCQRRSPLSDGSHSYDTDSLAGDLTSWRYRRSLTTASDSVIFNHVTIQAYHHAYRLLRHSFRRIPSGVHHHYATTLALVHVNMVETRKRYRKHLQVRTRVKEILPQRHVALNNDVGSCCPLNVQFRLPVRIYHHLMSLFLQIVTSLLNGFYSESQWLQKDYLHRSTFFVVSNNKDSLFFNTLIFLFRKGLHRPVMGD